MRLHNPISLAAFLCLGLSSLAGLAVNPPTEKEIESHGVTFKQLVEIQQTRDELFPSHLRDRFGSLQALPELDEPSSSDIGVAQRLSSNLTNTCKSLCDGLKCYGGAVVRFYAPKTESKEVALLRKSVKRLSSVSLNEAFLKLETNIPCLESAFTLATENPLTHKNLSALSRYDLANQMVEDETSFKFLRDWRDDLGKFLFVQGPTLSDMEEILSLSEQNDVLSADERALLRNYIRGFAQKAELIKTYLRQTAEYLDFEEKCHALRLHFAKGQSVASTIIEGQIRRGVSVDVWLLDLLRYGQFCGQQKTLLEHFLWTLEKLNEATRLCINDNEVCAQIDAAYRIAFLMLQSLDLVVDYRDLAIERQLALNGTTLADAYKSLIVKIYGELNPKDWTRPDWSLLSNGMGSLKEFLEKNPLEAEIFAADLAHCFSMLTNSAGDIVGQIRALGNNILNRRVATDFVRDIVFGKYAPVYESSKLASESIALLHLAGSLKYVVGAIEGVTNQNLGSTLALVCASAIGVSTGTALPAVILKVGQGLFGALQVHVEKKLADQLSESVMVQAVLSGLLRTFETGDLGDGLRRAASLTVARQLAGTIGTNWCDYREDRARNIIFRTAGAVSLLALPVGLGVSYYFGMPMDWVCNRELVQGAACTAAYCTAQIRTPSKSERIQARIDSIMQEIDGLNAQRFPELTIVAKARLKQAVIIDDLDASKQSVIDTMCVAIDQEQNMPLADGVTMRALGESLLSNPSSHLILSPLGLLQLQMISKAGGLV